MPTATAEDTKKPEPFVMIGGGQREVSEKDLADVTFTIRVHMHCKTDDREVGADVPLYEVPLLKLKWMDAGGEAILEKRWLPSKFKHPRLVKLSMDKLTVEAQRMNHAYRLYLKNGGHRAYFDEVYGKIGKGNPFKGFLEVIEKQRVAWRALERKIRDGHEMRVEDLQEIIDIATPSVGIEEIGGTNDFSDITIQDLEKTGTESDTMMGLSDDHLAGLRDFLYRNDWQTETIMDVCAAMGKGLELTPAMISGVTTLHGKPKEQRKIHKDYMRFMDEEARKIDAEEAKETV